MPTGIDERQIGNGLFVPGAWRCMFFECASGLIRRFVFERLVAEGGPRWLTRFAHFFSEAFQFGLQLFHRRCIGGVGEEVFGFERILLAIEKFPVVHIRLVIMDEFELVGDHAVMRSDLVRDRIFVIVVIKTFAPIRRCCSLKQRNQAASLHIGGNRLAGNLEKGLGEIEQ